MTRIVALVPMRHQSARVPGKNYRPLAGKPLYQHITATLLACPEIDQVVVDTDSPLIAQGLRQTFPQVQVLERPEHLRAEAIPMNEVLAYDPGQVAADFYLQTHSTNPLLRARSISSAIRALLADAVAILEGRAEHLAATGQRVWEPSPDRPALVIIVDEYAELAENAPEAASEADSIGRRGRAVAVTLIAAT